MGSPGGGGFGGDGPSAGSLPPQVGGQVLGTGFRVPRGGGAEKFLRSRFHPFSSLGSIDRVLLGEKDLLSWLLILRKDAGLQSHPNRSSSPIHSLYDLE